MHKKIVPALSIIAYVLAGILLLYSVWAEIYCVNYLSDYFLTGQLTFAGNEFDIVNYHVSTYGQYVLFAIVLFMLGWILQSLPQEAPAAVQVEDEVEVAVEE